MSHPPEPTWQFIDDDATFTLKNPHHTSALYFPLVNEAGMMSAITPRLHGDIKTGQNTFLNPPVSVEDLHNSRSARNFWVFIEGVGPWSAAGNSAAQHARRFEADEDEPVSLEADFLWHKITRENPSLGLRAEITNFAPPGHEQVELMRVSLTNLGQQPLTLIPTAAIPLYGRSADALRDHRHVTSLLHRLRTDSHGVLLCPTLTFDERGHKPNTVTYAVMGFEADGAPPASFFPLVEDFIGEGGNLEWPEAVVKNLNSGCPAGHNFEGFEAIGGLRFQPISLNPGDSRAYVLVMAVLPPGASIESLRQNYGGEQQFDDWLARAQTFWQEKVGSLSFHTGDARVDGWLKWVTLQPILRRLMGNSFLPYHDYGRGGRGWRDLWQDSLALLMLEPDNVGELLASYFAGVRFDGSNATIIGDKPGEFKADRNNIPRVWMDHGAWPFLTTQLYLDQTGDLAFLLQKQPYFKDAFTHRTQVVDEAWQPAQGTQLRTAAGDIYRGTILEHLLIQHLTAFFNVGEHNIIRLEGADWNDGLDMAPDRGESAAFSALYAANLGQLSRLLPELAAVGITEVELATELLLLLDTLAGPVDYDSPAAKQQRLADFFAAGQHTIAGATARLSLAELARDLAAKADWLANHLRRQEWIHDREGYGWFNGYYDNDGQQVEGDHPDGVRMTLTGQVFTLMGGIATDDQAADMIRAADRYLFDPQVGGYRLNTDFGQMRLNLGRAFGFAFGHKENGAMFSHMAVMYANALYQRGFVQEGYELFATLYRHCQDFPQSRMYPGVPEYVNSRGRGVYPYLTGSASWLLLTLLTEVFGVRGKLGDLVLAPKLVCEQFDGNGRAAVTTLFAGRQLTIVYHNPAQLDFGQYAVKNVQINNQPLTLHYEDVTRITVPRRVIMALAIGQSHLVDVWLG